MSDPILDQAETLFDEGFYLEAVKQYSLANELPYFSEEERASICLAIAYCFFLNQQYTSSLEFCKTSLELYSSGPAATLFLATSFLTQNEEDFVRSLESLHRLGFPSAFFRELKMRLKSFNDQRFAKSHLGPSEQSLIEFLLSQKELEAYNGLFFLPRSERFESFKKISLEILNGNYSHLFTRTVSLWAVRNESNEFDKRFVSEYLDHLTARFPGNFMYEVLRGLHNLDMTRLDEALLSFQHAVNLNSESWLAHSGWGIASGRLKHYKTAFNHLEHSNRLILHHIGYPTRSLSINRKFRGLLMKECGQFWSGLKETISSFKQYSLAVLRERSFVWNAINKIEKFE
ncbi:MAG: hypothetical protein KIT45_09735 [Fimbriimonadia bacterium]|nr:hypothetical protein [Fimbriimonadia bacterium]